ncbi:MurT ligase domain-containing protein [Eggerthella timonensis]|uniref:MurT ligase domain-containing protein n=1 Tax=Eggerthella timonensis TaxID=1871008 RepID=UPI000C75DA02|nr:MurT ligase domain-containing protein [Eggerthella timonensis]
MGLQFAGARAVSAVSTWGLKNVFRRPAANFPGKIALYLDPRLIADLAPKLERGSVCVVGTNGKTTVTNLLADALELAGNRVVCNRTGANLDSGVATSLLHAGPSDWGVFECDELWLAKILPQLQATYVVLLNLFRDQLDRVGEIDRIQDSIVGALEKSPNTVLVYNADDPLCARIAERAANRSIAFGVNEDLGLPQNSVADAQMCQRCSSMLEYAYRQYGQLGAFSCPTCGFARPALDYAAEDVQLGLDGLSFSVRKGSDEEAAGSINAPYTGAYMVYNLLATAAAADLAGCPLPSLQKAIDAFDPQNGRLQTFGIAGRRVLLNLAKNPTGFNQNLKIVAQDPRNKVVAFFVNDKEGDGRDVSWLWDIDFEELADDPADLTVFAGGIRANDMQVRLKYAGIDAQVVADADDLLERIANLPTEENAYLIANYTALPPVHAVLTARAEGDAASRGAAGDAGSDQPASAPADAPARSSSGAERQAAPASAPSLTIAHLFPDLLNLYGDGGNVRILEQRLRWRGIPVEVKRVNHGEAVDLSGVDLVMLGGGPDREQRLASDELMGMRDQLRAYVEDGGVLLAICGGYQILGHEWLLGDEVVKGLGIVDMTTERASGGSGDRLIDNIVLTSPLAKRPVVGYENHAGRTHLGAGVEPFGSVASATGHGNNDADKQDGVRYKNVVGTYLHGPLLAKNPEVADDLLARALDRLAARTGQPAIRLEPLDDAVEQDANDAMTKKLGVRA